MNGIRIRFETKPGSRAPRPGSCRARRRARRSPRPSRRRSRARGSPRRALRTGTGLKKCMPITRSGRPVTAASDGDRDRRRVRGEHAPPRGHRRVGPPGTASFFISACSTIASISRSAVDELGTGVTRSEDLVRGRAALLGEPGQARRIVSSAAVGRARGRVVEEDAPARGGNDLRDAGTHLAGAGDEDAVERHGGGYSALRRPVRACGAGGSSTRAPPRGSGSRSRAGAHSPWARRWPRAAHRVQLRRRGAGRPDARSVEVSHHPERLVVEKGLVRRVDEPGWGVDVDLSPHRPLDVLVDEELVDAGRADRRGPLRGHAADECDVDLGEALVSGTFGQSSASAPGAKTSAAKPVL